MAAKLMRK